MGPRDAEAHALLGPREGRALGAQRDVVGAEEGGLADVTSVQQRLGVGRVPQDRAVGTVQEGQEGVLHLGLGAVGRVVVELHVGDHRQLGRQAQERAIGLVGLHDHPLPRSPCGVGRGRAQLAADEVARIHVTAQQGVGGHGRRRGLPVRPRDRDAALECGELGQQLATVALDQPTLASGGQLGVVARDRRGEHHLDVVAGGQIDRVMADRRGHPGRPHALQVGRLPPIAAGHPRAQGVGDQGQAAHARPADPDEVQAPPVHLVAAKVVT